MKRFYTLLILYLGIFSTLMAHDAVVNGIYYNLDTTNKTAEVTYKGNYYHSEEEYSGSVVIPSSITYNSEIYSVTSIGQSAFHGCRGLTSVAIGNSVTSIGQSAFRSCSGLTSVAIGNSVTSIGKSAYRDCSGLTSITIPNSVISIGDEAFWFCSGLTSIAIGNSVTSIGDEAFYECSLTSITIPSSVTFIDEWAFLGCSKLTSVVWNAKNYGDFNVYTDTPFKETNNLTSFTIGNNVEHIPAYICYGVESLKEVTIPNSVTSIGISAFKGCGGLTSVIIPNSVTSVGGYTFQDCSSLTSVVWNAKNCADFGSHQVAPFKNTLNLSSFTFGNEVEHIPAYLLYEESNLKNITIPNSVTSIGSLAFYNCSSLTSVSIGESVKEIGNYAFVGCDKLEEVTAYPTAVPDVDKNPFSNYNAYLYVPCASKADYELDDIFGNFQYIECLTGEGGDENQGGDEGGDTPENPDTPVNPTPDPEPIPDPTPTPGGDITLYYVNNTNWATVYAYVWPTGGEGILAWPGAPATKTDMTVNGYDVYSYTFESTKADNIIFNNGSGGSGNQTSDLLIDVGKHYFYDGAWYASLNFDAEEGGTGEFDDSIVIINGICYELQSNNTAKVVYLRDKNGGRLDYSGNIEIPSTITYKEKTYSVTTIGANAFLGSELTEIEIPAIITTVESDAFWGANYLTSINYLGTVDQWAEIEFADEHSNPMRSGATFYIKGEKLTTVSIEKASVVKQYAFTYNSSIISVKLGNSVIEIQKSAFEGATNIERVEIGENISSIGNGAFRYINALSELTIHAVTVPTLASNWKPHDYIHLYVPCESLDLYKNALYFVYEIQCISNEGDGEDPENPNTPEPEPDPTPDPEPEPEPTPGGEVTLYYVNKTDWSAVNAYVWDAVSGTPIVAWSGEPATKLDKTVDGYEVYSYTFDSSLADRIIFNNDNGGEGNQTQDLIFEASKPYFYDGVWYETLTFDTNGGGTVDPTPDPEPEPEPDPAVPAFIVAGNGGSDATDIWCNGIEWDGTAEANRMKDADKNGIFEITYSNVPAGTWSFKVVVNTEPLQWLGGDFLDKVNSSAGYTIQDGGNIGFSLSNAADVTIKIDSADGKITLTTPSGNFGKVKIDYFSVANSDECLVENRFTATNNNTLKYTENIQILEGNDFGFVNYRIIGNCNYAVFEKHISAEVAEAGIYDITIVFNGDYENPDFTITAVKQGGTIDPDPVVAIKNLMIQPFEQVLPNTTTTTVATFTLQNANTATVSIEGLDADFFEIGEQNIGNGECSVSIVFKPIVKGVYYATLVVTTDDEVSLSIDFAAVCGDETFEPGDVPELNPDPVNPGTPDDDINVSVEEVPAVMIYAKEGTVYSEVDFEIYSLAGVNVTSQNGSLQGVYIVKTAEGNRLVSVW